MKTRSEVYIFCKKYQSFKSKTLAFDIREFLQDPTTRLHGTLGCFQNDNKVVESDAVVMGEVVQEHTEGLQVTDQQPGLAQQLVPDVVQLSL